MNVVFLGLGGNMGDTELILHKARKLIDSECGKVIKESSLYKSKSWGFESASFFLNQVIEINTDKTAFELIEKLLEIENKLGRKREKGGYSDRVIDLDILLFNAEHIQTESIMVPHPRMHLRKFVLLPLSEIAPELRHPTLGKTIGELLVSCEDTVDVKKY